WLSKETRPQVLEVSFLTPDAQRAWRQRYTVVNGRVSSATLGQIRDEVLAAARAPKAAPVAPAPPPATTPAAPPVAGPAAAARAAAAPSAPPPRGELARPPVGTDIAPPSATESAELGGPPKPDLLEIEIAAQLLHRSWDYSGYDPSGGLRTYTLSI